MLWTLFCGSALLNVVGVYWAGAIWRQTAAYEKLAAGCQQKECLPRKVDDPELALAYAAGSSRLWICTNSASCTFCYAPKLEIDDACCAAFAIGRGGKGGADGSCTLNNAITFLSSNMVAIWDHDSDGHCCNVMVGYNSAPVLYDKVGDGVFSLNQRTQAVESWFKEAKDSLRMEKDPK